MVRQKPRLAERVVTSLRHDIVSGMLQPGSQLPTEPALMQQFGVSRTVLREAMAALRAEGLVLSTQGRGVYVTEALPTASVWLTPVERASIPHDFELLEFRLVYEPEAAAQAALRCTPAQEYEIRAANLRMQALVEAGTAPHDANLEFHLAVARGTGNSCFETATRTFGPMMSPRGRFPNLSPAQTRDYLRLAIAEHARIVEAIAARDPDAARAAMRAHVESSRREYRKVVDRMYACPDPDPDAGAVQDPSG